MGIREPYKSVGESIIAEILERYGIEFEYERSVLVQEKHEGDTPKARIWYPDFYLPKQNVIVEYFGMTHDEAYRKNVEWKKKVYGEMGFRVVLVYRDDVFNGRRLRKDFEKNFIVALLFSGLDREALF